MINLKKYSAYFSIKTRRIGVLYGCIKMFCIEYLTTFLKIWYYYVSDFICHNDSSGFNQVLSCLKNKKPEILLFIVVNIYQNDIRMSYRLCMSDVGTYCTSLSLTHTSLCLYL